MKANVLLFLIGALLLSACTASPMGVGFWRNYESNGERIYFTATNDSGKSIRYSDGPAYGGMMMDSQLSCASCHNSDGTGGEHVMHMQWMDAPDIRFAALSGEEHGHDDDHDDDHGEYDLEAFRQAVVEGLHPDGESLSADMPRWKFSDQDLADLFEFLQTLP